MNAPVTNVTNAKPAGNVLSSKALLVRLTIKKWSATKHDKAVSKQVTDSKHASADAGRFNKRLVEKDALAAIQSIASAARAENYARTLPWSDEGFRILPTVGFIDWAAKMSELEGQFNAAADSFIATYPQAREQARQVLGELFESSDYPEPDDIRAKFDFDLMRTAFPEAADFRADLSENQAQQIRAEMEADARAAFETATRDVWRRIAEGVGHMAEKLAAYRPAAGKGDRADGVFRDSLVENVRELVDLLPALNIAGDPELTKVAERMRQELCAEDAKTLRESETTRESVAKAAEAICEEVSQYLA